MQIHVFPSSRALMRSILLAAAAIFLLVLACVPSRAQEDPPAQVGRLSIVSGTVSIQPAGADEWNQAELNWPVGPGDRIFTDNDGRAEIQLGQTFLRIGPGSDVTLSEDTANSISIGVAQGAVHVRCQGLWPGQSLHVDTPSGSASLDQPGEMRVDVYAGEQASIFTPLANQAVVTGAGNYFQQVYAGQALELAGSNPVYPQWLAPAAFDSLDQWSVRRDRQIATAPSFRYVNAEIPGADELDQYGTWRPASEYGPIWFPNNVPTGWAPYHYGHWVNHDPWGWVWVEEEPWGYAPFHYGRWVNYGGRWGWIPGPVQAHPVWSPALVVFAGGIQAGGVGLSVWFPLGPGEPYHPWYHSSQRYIDQINISNIRESQRVHVQKTYVNINVTNITYVNRTIGVSAMRENDFAAGRRAHQASVQIDAHAVDRPQILEAPRVQPNPRQMVTNRPQRAVPVEARRPTLINEKGMAVEAKPNAQPVAVPTKSAPVVRTLPGRTVVAPPPTATGTAGRTNGAQPAASGTAAPNNNPGAQPNNRQWPQSTTQPGATNQPGARQPQGTAQPGNVASPPSTSQPGARPNANPASGAAGNPAPGLSGQPANQNQPRPGTGASAQPGAVPARGTTAQPNNVPPPPSTSQPGVRQPQGTAQPGNVASPPSTSQPGARPNANPASSPTANPPAGSSNQPANPNQSKPAPASGAQPAPENRQWPQSGNQPGARQTQQPGANAAPQSGTRPSQGTEARPGAAPAANSPTQPNAKPAPQADQQGNQKKDDQKKDEKKKDENKDQEK